MYQTINHNSNNDEWILLIHEDEFSDKLTESTTKSKSSEDESFNSDDVLALKILDDTYDYEAQKPSVLAYPQEDNDCCYKSPTIKQLSSFNIKQKIIACVFILGICTSIGFIIYFTTQLEK
jgi:hypothetical protein